MFETIIALLMAGSFVWIGADAKRDLTHTVAQFDETKGCIVKNDMTRAHISIEGKIITKRIKDIDATGVICIPDSL